MFTLQILDAGQSFLHSLDGKPVTFGSSDSADVRLHAGGVASRHAELAVQGDRVQLQATADVLVNGAATREAALGLGDRVEIGEAVFVVGRAAADLSLIHI